MTGPDDFVQRVEIPYRLRPGDLLHFLHIPKTGGVSLQAFLHGRFARGQVYRDYGFPGMMSAPPASWDGYRLISSHLGYKVAEIVRRPMIFLTLLREPVGRVVSFYRHARRHPGHFLHALVRREDLSLDDFVRHPDCVPFLRDNQTFKLAFKERVMGRPRVGEGPAALTDREVFETRRQVDAEFRARPAAELVGRACRRLEAMAFVGLTERMRESVGLLARTFRWPAPARPPALNAAPEGEAGGALPPGTRAAIEDITRLDAQVYAHACRLFEQRLRAPGRRGWWSGLLRAA